MLKAHGLNIPSGMQFSSANDAVMFHAHVDEDGYLHPVILSTVRCHARLDDPSGPSFEVAGNEVFSVPGQYCGNMWFCSRHEAEGRQWGRDLVGHLIPL